MVKAKARVRPSSRPIYPPNIPPDNSSKCLCPCLKHDSYTAGVWVSLAVVLAGLFVLQSAQNSYAKFITPARAPIPAGDLIAASRAAA
jgi:hypothetical protein